MVLNWLVAGPAHAAITARLIEWRFSSHGNEAGLPTHPQHSERVDEGAAARIACVNAAHFIIYWSSRLLFCGHTDDV
jgi:hypothetical protein